MIIRARELEKVIISEYLFLFESKGVTGFKVPLSFTALGITKVYIRPDGKVGYVLKNGEKGDLREFDLADIEYLLYRIKENIDNDNIALNTDSDFQKRQVEKLRSGELKYEDAAIYTILLELLTSDSVSEVFSIFHNVASDIGKRDELEFMFDEAKRLDRVTNK